MLNNEGWGLSTFIGFCLIFMVAILVVSINAYKVGVAAGYTTGEITFNNNDDNYTTIENTLMEAGKRYYQNNSDKTYVTLSNLVKDNYLTSLKDNNNNSCSGYVKFNKDGDNIIYTPYIKCGNKYQTSGYMDEFEN